MTDNDNAIKRCMPQLRLLHQYRLQKQQSLNDTAPTSPTEAHGGLSRPPPPPLQGDIGEEALHDAKLRELKFAFDYCVAKPWLTADLKREVNHCIRRDRLDQGVVPVDPQVEMDQMVKKQRQQQQRGSSAAKRKLLDARKVVHVPELRVDPSRFGTYCSFVWNDLVARRMREMDLSYMVDMSESTRIESAYALYEALEYVDERRAEQNVHSFEKRDEILAALKRARELSCHKEPEGLQSTECLQLREKLFNPIGSSSCREVFVEAQECSKELDELSDKSMLYYAFRSWDAGTRDTKRRTCAEMSMHALQCFNKYFAFHLNHPDLLDPKVDVLGKLRKFTSVKRQAELDNKSGQIRSESQFRDVYDEKMIPEMEKELDDHLVNLDLTEEEEAEARIDFERMKAKQMTEEYKKQEGH